MHAEKNLFDTRPNVLAVILARGGSKGLPRKNLMHLGGLPLVCHPVLYALRSGIEDVIVSTDSTEIAAAAQKVGAKIPFMRPSELSEDHTTTEAALQHALIETEVKLAKKYDLCVFLTATDVFRIRQNWIGEGIEKLSNDEKLESYFVGNPTHKNFWELSKDGKWHRIRDWMATYESRQTRQFIVREDTGLACVSRSSLWREGRRIGDNVYIAINNDSFSNIDIHTEEDYLLAKAAYEIRYGKNE